MMNNILNKGMKVIELLNIVFVQSIISLIANFFPKDKNLIVIGTSLGRNFSDNSKYLYLYFHQSIQNKNKMIWITKNKKVNRYLKSINLPCEYLYSLKGLFYTIRASKVFISHSVKDINGALINGAEIIQLWHGQPLKKIGFNGDWFSEGIRGGLKLRFYGLFSFSYYMKCDKVITFSNMEKEIFKEAFKYSFRDKNIDKNILKLGQPRNDSLNNGFIFQETFFPEIKQLNKIKDNYTKIISWLPTHRLQLKKTIVDIIIESNLDLERLNGFFKKNNSLFVIKAHFLELELLKHRLRGYDNILIYELPDPYPLLHFTDILITDYSSVYFDFLITNKPIIFAPFDFYEYKKTVKFYYEYTDITPGKKCITWVEIEEEILTILSGIDSFKGDREKLLNERGFIVDNNSKNIVKYFGLAEDNNK